MASQDSAGNQQPFLSLVATFLQDKLREQSIQYNYDFEKDKPKNSPGRYLWEAFDEVYRENRSKVSNVSGEVRNDENEGDEGKSAEGSQ